MHGCHRLARSKGCFLCCVTNSQDVCGQVQPEAHNLRSLQHVYHLAHRPGMDGSDVRGCRGRWDVIEAKVAEHKAALQEDMQAWMAKTAAGLRAEFEASAQAAAEDALAAQQHGGATSDAHQPALA